MSKLTLPKLPSEKTVEDIEYRILDRRILEIAAEIDARRVAAGLPPVFDPPIRLTLDSVRARRKN